LCNRKAAAHDLGDLTNLLDHGGKFFRLEGLFTIGNRMRRIRMDFDDKSIRARGNTRACDRGDIIRMTRGMGWIEDHRQMSKVFQNGNGIDIGRVASGCFKGADTTLT
jgi:hypothetical protein